MRKYLLLLFVITSAVIVTAQTTVNIQPANIKQSTGVYVMPGEQITIKSEGRWSLWDKYTPATADGHPFRANDFGNWGVLLGQIGSGEIFVVGVNKTITSTNEGILYLFPNKGNFLIENPSGQLSVSITGGRELALYINSIKNRATQYTYKPADGILVTQVYVRAGESIEIFATGSWTMWEGTYPMVNAEGHEFVADGVEWGKLFGGVGSSEGIMIETFRVGEKCVFTPTKSGILSFYPYINNYVSSRNGSMDIYILGGTQVTNELKVQADNGVLADLNSRVAARISAFRQAAGLSPVEISLPLSQSALDHAKYMILNGVFERNQVEGNPGYTGATPEERAAARGFNDRVREIFCQTEDIERAVDIFIDSVYHRVRLLDPNIKYIGYGSFNDQNQKKHVFVLGYASSDIELTQDYILYPVADSTSVPSSWSGLENPDPLPNGAMKPTGYPISITYKNQLIRVTKSELKDSAGRVVPVFLITPDTDINGKNTNSVFIIPRTPLRSGEIYTAVVEAVCRVGDTESPISTTWSFTIK